MTPFGYLTRIVIKHKWKRKSQLIFDIDKQPNEKGRKSKCMKMAYQLMKNRHAKQ